MEKPDTNVPMTPSTPSMPNTSCGADKGTLPCPCAPLAFPYIPMQENNPVRFSRMEALQTGTLFPGLDLPFKAAIQAKIRRRCSCTGPISSWPRRAGRNTRRCTDLCFRRT